MDTPNPWQSLERWRRVTLCALGATVALAYVARAVSESADFPSRVVVVIACLAALAIWSRRPRTG